MRVLFLALLLVNVAFFAWEYRHPEAPPAPVAATEPGVPTIQLLSERPPQPAAAPAPAAKPAPAATPKSKPKPGAAAAGASANGP